MHVTSTFNVENTLNEWLQNGLAALTKPAWLPSYTFVQNFQKLTASLPAVSVHHLSGVGTKKYEGDNAELGVNAIWKHGIMDVSVWVKRSNLNSPDNHTAQLRTLQAMVEEVATATQGVVIKDWQTSQGSPQATAYRVNIGNVAVVDTGQDPNPDIERRRILINYDWNLRA